MNVTEESLFVPCFSNYDHCLHVTQWEQRSFKVIFYSFQIILEHISLVERACLYSGKCKFQVILDSFQVILDHFRSFQVIPCFGNYDPRLHITQWEQVVYKRLPPLHNVFIHTSTIHSKARMLIRSELSHLIFRLTKVPFPLSFFSATINQVGQLCRVKRSLLSFLDQIRVHFAGTSSHINFPLSGFCRPINFSTASVTQTIME